MPESTASLPCPELLVACLCAEWCRTCGLYRDTFEAARTALQSEYPARPMRFVWVDIEDESDLVGDLDIENFPTLVLAAGERVLFAGTVMPHLGTVERLVQGAIDGSLGTPREALAADILALPGRLAGHPPL
jgi:hypothetical protein